MNPAYPSLPASSWELALLIVLGAFFLVFLIVGGALRLATKWVAGFTPPWGRAIGAILCMFLVAITSGMVLASLLGVDVASRDPLKSLLIILGGFFLEALCCKAILAGEDAAEEISVIQAALILIVERLIIFVPLAFIVVSAVLFVGMGQVHRILAEKGMRGPWPSGANARPAPAYATVADAQKEAVRRYPQLAVQGSRFNKAYVDRYRLYQNTRPSYFADNSWPVRLADETANDSSAW